MYLIIPFYSYETEGAYVKISTFSQLFLNTKTAIHIGSICSPYTFHIYAYFVHQLYSKSIILYTLTFSLHPLATYHLKNHKKRRFQYPNFKLSQICPKKLQIRIAPFPSLILLIFEASIFSPITHLYPLSSQAIP